MHWAEPRKEHARLAPAGRASGGLVLSAGHAPVDSWLACLAAALLLPLLQSKLLQARPWQLAAWTQHASPWCPPPQCVEESDLIFAASGSEELLVHKEDIENMPAASDKVRQTARVGCCLVSHARKEWRSIVPPCSSQCGKGEAVALKLCSHLLRAPPPPSAGGRRAAVCGHLRAAQHRAQPE